MRTEQEREKQFFRDIARTHARTHAYTYSPGQPRPFGSGIGLSVPVEDVAV